MTPSDVVAALHTRDPIAGSLGVELVQVLPAGVVLRMVVDNAHLGENDVCHGGVLFTLADIAMSYVGNRDNHAALATAASIDFIDRVVLGDVVEAVGLETSLRGRAAICDVELSVDGRVVALFRGNTLRTQGPAVQPD